MTGHFGTLLGEKSLWLFDGAMGSLLQQRGLPVGEAPEAYLFHQPDEVHSIHAAYVAAGSDIIQTNTFGANAIRLAHYGLADRTEEINSLAVDVARNAAGRKALVAGSMGPMGDILEPYGTVSREVALTAFQRQAQGLKEADFINIETMGSLEEAMIAVEAVKESVDLPISVTMTFAATPKGLFTMMGETPQVCAEALTARDVGLVGANCGAGVEEIIRIISQMREATALPLLAKPNAGLPELQNGKEIYPETPDSFSGKMAALVQLGVRVIGGCCGTTPNHIRQLRTMIDSIDDKASF